MIAGDRPTTVDTNIAVYALATDDKAEIAGEALRGCEFLSVQVLNEYVSVASRKRRDPWNVIADDLDALREAVPAILPLTDAANRTAVRISARYRLAFYDALMLAVALEGGARTIYSEDMQHGLLIDGALRIVDPFR